MPIKDKFYQRIRKVLSKHGVLDEGKADEAVAIAERENLSYTDVLLEHQMVDEMGYLSAIAQETNMPPVDIEKIEYDEDALAVINQELASYYCVLPLSKIGNVLTVAVGNPFDMPWLRRCAIDAGRRVRQPRLHLGRERRGIVGNAGRRRGEVV